MKHQKQAVKFCTVDRENCDLIVHDEWDIVGWDGHCNIIVGWSEAK